MITQFIRERDGDSCIIKTPDDDEIQCECDRIVLEDKSFECEICHRHYCPGCGTEDYKNTGWFICINCLFEPELIIDALLEELNSKK